MCVLFHRFVFIIPDILVWSLGVTICFFVLYWCAVYALVWGVISVMFQLPVAILQNVPRSAPVLDLYENFNTLNILDNSDLHNFQIFALIQKFLYHRLKIPVIFSSYCNENFLFYDHDRWLPFCHILFPFCILCLGVWSNAAGRSGWSDVERDELGSAYRLWCWWFATSAASGLTSFLT